MSRREFDFFIIILFWKSVPFNKSSFLFIKVEDAFEKNEVDVVAEKLTGMQASLRLLQHAADYQVEYVLDYSSMLQTIRYKTTPAWCRLPGRKCSWLLQHALDYQIWLLRRVCYLSIQVFTECDFNFIIVVIWFDFDYLESI